MRTKTVFKRRSVGSISCLVAGSFIIVSCGGGQTDSAHEPTNLVLVTIDTLRADRVGAYGGPAGLTPNLDALGIKGVTFLDATAHAPLTLPSHASVMTGQFPNRLGVYDNAGFPLSPASETLAEILSRAGYRTAAFVSSYVLNRRTGIAQGFETFVDRFATGAVLLTPSGLERPGPEVATEAAEWLENAPEPFFLWVHFYDPHAPYDAPPAFAEQWPQAPYNAEVATSDWALGDLLRGIPTSVKDRTLVAVTADHGESLGEHGEPEHGIFLYDATLKVPLVISGPGLPEAVTLTDQVRHVDMVPTLLDLLRIPPPAELDGESLLPLIVGKERPAVPIAYSESWFGHLHFGCSPLRAARNGEWKYIEAPKQELYNLRQDPVETNNRREQDSGVMRELVQELGNLPRSPSPSESQPIDSATAERLRSLGYLGGTVGSPGQRGTAEDPKDRINDYVAYISTFNNALQALGDGDTQRAADGFGELVELFPASFEAHQYLGRALSARGDYAGALRAYEEAMTLSPQSSIVYLDAALSLVGENRFDSAFEYVKKGLEVEPESFYGYLVEGMVAREAGQDFRASEAFRKALSLNSELAMAEYQLGAMSAERGEIEEAALRFQKALEIDPAFQRARMALKQLGMPN